MLSGGKFMDEGLYGCIFTPPLKCKEGTKKELTDDVGSHSLSKIILTPYAKKEYSIASKVHKIPLWKNYFVVSESICEPDSIQKERDFSDCKVLTEYKLSDFKILNMPYGGKPLYIYKFNLQTFDFLEFVIHLMEAGALLNIFGIVHRDIHQGNILIDDNEVPRIIDFNLAIPVDNSVTDSKLKHNYSYDIPTEPPDSTLVNAISLGYNGEKVINTIIEKKTIIKKIRTVLGTSEEEMRKSFDIFYAKSKSVKIGDSSKWFETYWRTIDSWAIGINIVDLISKFSLWPEFSQTLKQTKPKLFPVLRRLCEVSPLKRIDCVQALNYLSPSSFIIRKYGKSWLEHVGDGNII
jgi:serine/threonine protein kinase